MIVKLRRPVAPAIPQAPWLVTDWQQDVRVFIPHQQIPPAVLEAMGELEPVGYFEAEVTGNVVTFHKRVPNQVW